MRGLPRRAWRRWTRSPPPCAASTPTRWLPSTPRRPPGWPTTSSRRSERGGEPRRDVPGCGASLAGGLVAAGLVGAFALGGRTLGTPDAPPVVAVSLRVLPAAVEAQAGLVRHTWGTESSTSRRAGSRTAGRTRSCSSRGTAPRCPRQLPRHRRPAPELLGATRRSSLDATAEVEVTDDRGAAGDRHLRRLSPSGWPGRTGPGQPGRGLSPALARILATTRVTVPSVRVVALTPTVRMKPVASRLPAMPSP